MVHGGHDKQSDITVLWLSVVHMWHHVLSLPLRSLICLGPHLEPSYLLGHLSSVKVSQILAFGDLWDLPKV